MRVCSVKGRSLALLTSLGIRLLNLFHVRQVAKTPRSQLGRNQILFGDEEDAQILRRVNHTLLASFPGRIKLHAIDAGQDVDCNGRGSKATYLRGSSKSDS